MSFHRFDEELKGEVCDNPAFSQAGAGCCDPIVWGSMAQWVSLCVLNETTSDPSAASVWREMSRKLQVGFMKWDYWVCAARDALEWDGGCSQQLPPLLAWLLGTGRWVS